MPDDALILRMAQAMAAQSEEADVQQRVRKAPRPWDQILVSERAWFLWHARAAASVLTA